MLKLSRCKKNQFAIPRENIFLKTNSSSDLEIMTYLEMENLNRDLFGYNVQRRTSKLQNWIEDDSIERYIVPLDAIITKLSLIKT